MRTEPSTGAQEPERTGEAALRFLDALAGHGEARDDPNTVPAITLRLLGEQLGVSQCALAGADADDSRFTIRGSWAREGGAPIAGEYSIADIDPASRERLRDGAPLVINDGRAVIFPLVRDGRPVAILAASDERPRSWSTDDLRMIREAAERGWLHAEHARLAAELQDLEATLEQRVEERLAALERSQTQFRLLVQGVTDYAIFMLDTGGRVSSWNAGAERIKGYAPPEIIGRHFSTFYTDEDRAAGEPERGLETARREGRFLSEGWRRRKDGTLFRASVVIDAIHDDAGELIGFAKITRDVTERERAQRDLELAREALFQSQKLEAIGQLTGGVAHDFNNLLAAILSGLELLRKRVAPDPQVALLLDNSVRAAERGAALTQRMLAFARRQELKAEIVHVPALVADMMELLQRSLGPAFVLETRFRADLPTVLADVNQLEMALLNLAVNARDAMPDGGVITIHAADRRVAAGEVPGLAPGRYVRLTVTDNGSGMDADTLARATDPFFTTKGTGKGTGLGLSMVHGYLHQLGGAFELESELGKGTRAHIWLPARQAGARPQPHDPEAEAPLPTARRTILAVDDDALILMNTAALLEDLGHEVLGVTSGEEALSLIAQRPDIDLLVTDQIMPGMTGSELIAEVRKGYPALPIILATGYGEIPEGLGSTIHRLGKPFTQSALARAVRHVTG